MRLVVGGIRERLRRARLSRGGHRADAQVWSRKRTAQKNVMDVTRPKPFLQPLESTMQFLIMSFPFFVSRRNLHAGDTRNF
jgi:hypothetical protein